MTVIVVPLNSSVSTSGSVDPLSIVVRTPCCGEPGAIWDGSGGFGADGDDDHMVVAMSTTASTSGTATSVSANARLWRRRGSDRRESPSLA